jgi:hypothetical protein
MRFGKPAAAACVLAAGLAAGGCASGANQNAAAGGRVTTAAGTATTGVASGAGAGAGSGVAGDGGSATPVAAGGSNGSGGSGTSGGGSNCQAANLRFQLGSSSGGASQTTQAVDLVNSGSAPCTMNGFPGVDMVGMANGQQDYSWSLERSNAAPGTVTLQPGATAHFDLVYLPEAAGDSSDISVMKLVITPPNTFTQAQVTFTESILLQDGATRPGTYISPISAGA